MRMYKEISCEDLLIKEDSQYNNLDCENVTIAENITVRLYGTIKKSLTIKSGAVVHLHGRLLGTLANEGGQFNDYGILSKTGS